MVPKNYIRPHHVRAVLSRTEAGREELSRMKRRYQEKMDAIRDARYAEEVSERNQKMDELEELGIPM